MFQYPFWLVFILDISAIVITAFSGPVPVSTSASVLSNLATILVPPRIDAQALQRPSAPLMLVRPPGRICEPQGMVLQDPRKPIPFRGLDPGATQAHHLWSIPYRAPPILPRRLRLRLRLHRAPRVPGHVHPGVRARAAPAHGALRSDVWT